MGLEESEAAERRLREDYGHVRYTGDECPNCGRQRLEECANGKVVCEKCHWEPAINDYNSDHLTLFR